MRIEVMGDLTETQAAEWRAFLDRSNHSHPEQDPGFAEGWTAQGHDVLFAMGREGDALRAVAMINLEPGLFGVVHKATAMSGPVCDDPDDMRAFLDELAGHPALRKVGHLTITPYWLASRALALCETLEDAGWAQAEAAEERMTGIHDVTGTPDDIAARFNKSARRKLRKARDLGLEVEYVCDEATAMQAFEIQNRHFVARTSTALDRQAFLSDFRNVYAQGDLGALFLVRHNGEILGGCVVHRSADTVFLRHSFIDDDAAARLGNLRLAPIVTLEGLSWGNAHGCRYGDENGYIHGLDPSHPLYRVYKYKEEFRPTEVQRMPGRRRVFRPVVSTVTELGERAAVRAKAAVAALRRRIRVDRSGTDARRGAVSPRAGGGVRNWRRAVKLPLALTIGGSAAWIVALLVD